MCWLFREVGSSLSFHDVSVSLNDITVPVHSTASERASGYTHHSGLRISLSSIAKGGGQGGGAALIVQGCPAVVDGRVDGDGPHARGIAITIAVVVAAAIPRGPHIDAAFAASALWEDRGDTNSRTCGYWGLQEGPARGWGSWPRTNWTWALWTVQWNDWILFSLPMRTTII